ncbi:MAG TPA: phosphoribosyltransferase [Longimicrobium sp.]|nr:phosphoribosyltransferase [Longimicrobium sp.]
MWNETIFRDRAEAGRRLAERLSAYAGRDDVVVLALPRGGVPVAYPVAHALGAPLDVLVVRKLGVPGQEEVAMGALASGGVRILNEPVVRALRIPAQAIERVAAREALELERREGVYRGARAPAVVQGRTVILVDDGIATGSNVRAAVQSLRQLKPARIVVASPVCSVEACRELEREVDEVLCLLQPQPLGSVSLAYASFPQTTDLQVWTLLKRAAQTASKPAPAPPSVVAA